MNERIAVAVRRWVAVPAMLGAVMMGLSAGEARGADRPGHPRLFFTAEELPALRAKLATEPFASRWEVFLELAERDLHARLPEIRNGRLRRGARDAIGHAGIAAFAYAITGDERFGERAKAEALGLVEASGWPGPSRLGQAVLETGEAATACALVYDWCYDLLSEAERDTLREGMLRLAVEPYLASLAKDDWWVGNYITNWNGVVHGGCGLAALVLEDESPRAAEAARAAWDHLQRFLREVNHVDGGGDEGMSYHIYGNLFAHRFATAWTHLRGDDGGLYAELADRLAGYWSVYMLAPDGDFANFNANNESELGRWPRGAESGPNAGLCALYESAVPGGDALLLWGADNGGTRFYWRRADPFWFLWRRQAPPAGDKPPLQEAVLFRGSGQAIWQSGGLWFALNGGWTSPQSHRHYDLGSFILLAQGERLARDWGRETNLTADHSTLLVDGQGQENNSRGRFLRFGSGEGFRYLACDLTNAYRKSLRRFVRHVVLVRGQYLVILDDLEALAPADFEWRLQSGADLALDPDARAAWARGRRQSLRVLAVGPADATLSTGRRWLALRPDGQRLRETLVTVLWPMANDAPLDVRAHFADGTLRITAGDSEDILEFTPGPAGWQLHTVNGADASAIPDGSERSLVPFRP